MKEVKPIVHSIKGSAPGKKVAIFCGIHGNERAGIMTIDYLKDKLKVIKGEALLVYANPPAIENNVRLVEQNLNRSFIKKKVLNNNVDKLALGLMNILDSCDALLDLHAYNERQGDSTPFIICETDCYDLVSKMDFKIVASGFDSIEKGSTDGYMFNQGKIGICGELGAIETPDDFIDLGIKTAYQFLQYFGMVVPKYKYDCVSQSFIKACHIHNRKSDDFKFSKKFKTFDEVRDGDLIATEDNKELKAPFDGRILFPQPNYPIGSEAYLLAKQHSLP